MKLLIIANPVSGGKKGAKQLPKIKNLFKQHQIQFEIKLTQYHGHAEEIIKKTDLKPYDCIAVVGGDGTNFQILNGLIKNHTTLLPVAIIPSGSGDSFALDLGIKSYADGVKAIVQNNIRPVDVLSFTSESEIFYCVNMIGMGFITEVAKIAAKLKFLRSLSYVVGVIYEIVCLKVHDIELKVNNEVISGKNCFIEFCNSKYTGGKMLMAPMAKIDDGYFDIIIASKLSRFKLLKAFPKIFNGTHIALDEVRTIKTKKAQLVTKKPATMLPDGEVFGKTPTDLNILPKKMKYFCLK